MKADPLPVTLSATFVSQTSPPATRPRKAPARIGGYPPSGCTLGWEFRSAQDRAAGISQQCGPRQALARQRLPLSAASGPSGPPIGSASLARLFRRPVAFLQTEGLEGVQEKVFGLGGGIRGSRSRRKRSREPHASVTADSLSSEAPGGPKLRS